jgi:PTS system mannose-specific IIA component
MIGLVVATHGFLGETLLETAAMIIGRAERVCAVSLARDHDPVELHALLAQAIDEVGPDNDGVLVMVDMFGGTPANIGMTMLKTGRVELLTGVNLPMLIKFFTYRDSCPLDQLAQRLQECARDGIVLAGEMLRRQA